MLKFSLTLALTMVICCSIFFLCCFLPNTNANQLNIPTAARMAQILIANKKINVEISDTEALRAQGLSRRDELPENQGMLFIFDSDVKTVFWMKSMRFNIDVIWIKDEKIIQIVENIPYPSKSNPKIRLLPPEHEFNRLLEMPAGWIKQNSIELGDSVQWVFP